MIKVLKTDDEFKETVCPRCKSELAYQKWDTDNRQLGDLFHCFIQCSVCYNNFCVEKVTIEDWFKKGRK